MVILILGYIGDWFWDFFFWQKFQNLSKFTYLIVYPPNQKDLISQWLRHQKNDTFVTFWPFFANLGIFELLGYFGPRLYRLLIWDFFWALISKSIEIDWFGCLAPYPKDLSFQWLRYKKNDTFGIFWPFFAFFGIFWLLCYFWAQIIQATDLRYFFSQNFKIYQNGLFWLSTPPNKRIWVPIG